MKELNNIENEIINFYRTELKFNFPFQYQIDVALNLLQGKNVIVSVPTGAGKTWASIVPFLIAKYNQEIHFPSKMIYSLPLRALTNSIYSDIKEVTNVSIQTGEYSEDKYYENDIIFSTIDQTLSSFLCFPLSLSERQANINAGALIGSYLVFDEFHLLEPNLSLATTLGMLKLLENLSRFCIMTATMSDKLMENIKHSLNNCEIITLDNYTQDISKIGSLKPEKNKKKLIVNDGTISSINIIDKHIGKTITICNRVETAQRLYVELLKEKESGNISLKKTDIICLHSRYFDEDRKCKEKKLKKLFGKGAIETNAILIATQVIEAGMDISCDVLHTEISPINSFLQRAGRCARFINEIGVIHIYDVLEIQEKELIKIEVQNEMDKKEIKRINSKYLPYEKDLCLKTYEELKNFNNLDGDVPKNLIKKIMGQKEEEIFQIIESGRFNRERILESWGNCTKNMYRNTIRDINNVEIAIIDDSIIDDIQKKPYLLQTVSMYKWSMVGWLNRISKGEGPLEYDEENDWLVKELCEKNIIDNLEDSDFSLANITNFSKIPNHIFVNSKYLGYDENYGFNWLYKESFGKNSPKRNKKENVNEFKPLKKDTFYEHIKALIGAFKQEFLGEDGNRLDFLFKELAAYIQMPEMSKDEFIKLIKIMIIFHDYGKLSDKWQKPMQAYQSLKDPTYIKNSEILAHTDYDQNSEMDKELAKKANLSSRPSHAGVGALAALYILGSNFKSKEDFLKVLSPLSTAIFRHHSPFNSTVENFEINKENFEALKLLYDEEIETFNFTDIKKICFSNSNHDLNRYLSKNENLLSMFIYFFLIRILRICDQKATIEIFKYHNIEEL